MPPFFRGGQVGPTPSSAGAGSTGCSGSAVHRAPKGTDCHAGVTLHAHVFVSSFALLAIVLWTSSCSIDLDLFVVFHLESYATARFFGFLFC